LFGALGHASVYHAAVSASQKTVAKPSRVAHGLGVVVGGAAAAATFFAVGGAWGILLAVLAGAAAGPGVHIVARRLLAGPERLSREYTLYFSADDGVTVGDLVRVLSMLQLACGIDDGNGAPVSMDAPLAHTPLRFRLGAPPDAAFGDGVALREREQVGDGEVTVGPFVVGAEGSTHLGGIVTAIDRQDGPHENLARFILYAFGKLYDYARYRDPFAAASLQSVQDLAWQVPAIGERIASLRGQL
jgi:hypothetical protein